MYDLVLDMAERVGSEKSGSSDLNFGSRIGRKSKSWNSRHVEGKDMGGLEYPRNCCIMVEIVLDTVPTPVHHNYHKLER